jgi:hypothetical protein
MRLCVEEGFKGGLSDRTADKPKIVSETQTGASGDYGENVDAEVPAERGRVEQCARTKCAVGGIRLLTQFPLGDAPALGLV